MKSLKIALLPFFLYNTQVNYVVQEAIVVIKDIFRKYPNKYESIISTLCENLDTLDEPEARLVLGFFVFATRYELLMASL